MRSMLEFACLVSEASVCLIHVASWAGCHVNAEHCSKFNLGCLTGNETCLGFLVFVLLPDPG